MQKKLFLIIFMLAGVCILSTPVIAQTDGQAMAQGRGSGPNLEAMIQRNSYAAGIAAVCRPDFYDRIRFCTMGIALSWRELTSIPIDVQSREIQSAIERTWQAGAIRGRDDQLRQGATEGACREFNDQIEKEELWRVCEDLRRAKMEEMQGSAPSERASPSTPQPQAQPQAPRSGGSRGFQIQ